MKLEQKEKDLAFTEISKFWTYMEEALPKSLEREALGDEAIYCAFVESYLKFRKQLKQSVRTQTIREVVDTLREHGYDQQTINFIGAMALKKELQELENNNE